MPIDAAGDGRGTEFLGISFATAPFEEVLSWCLSRPGRHAFVYAVTPNVDHVIRLFPRRPGPVTQAFRNSYAHAAIRCCDSRILHRLARIAGIGLPVVTGSDLTAALFTRGFGAGDRVALIGGGEDTIERLETRFPGPIFVQHIPPMGLATNEAAMESAADFLEDADADYVLFAVGAPQSEMLAHRCARRPGLRGLGLCIGASVDFLLGDQRRAPRWMQRAGLEWLFRLLSEPARLWRRYLVEGPRVFILFRQWQKGRLSPLTSGNDAHAGGAQKSK